MSARSLPISLVPTRLPLRLVLQHRLEHAWAEVGLTLRARATRRILAQMDARELSDIGLSPAQAQREAQRAFWDV